MDIRKLQRAIVDGLEDVKAQNILVFNTEHLSPLFERVIVASGASNRQTKALAASIRDAVRAAGKLSAAAKTRAGSTAARTGKAPAKTAAIKKVVVPANSSRNAATASKKTADKKAATKAAGAKKAAARRG